jgi:hypothetical protein
MVAPGTSSKEATGIQDVVRKLLGEMGPEQGPEGWREAGRAERKGPAFLG